MKPGGNMSRKYDKMRKKIWKEIKMPKRAINGMDRLRDRVIRMYEERVRFEKDCTRYQKWGIDTMRESKTRGERQNKKERLWYEWRKVIKQEEKDGIKKIQEERERQKKKDISRKNKSEIPGER